MATETRPMRMCDSCGQVDDHPRHVFALAEGQGNTDPSIAAKAVRAAGEENIEAILAQVQDSATIQKHMDCCRTDGCPDGSCNVVTAGAEDKKGDDLVAHLTSLKVEPDENPGGVQAGSTNDDHPFPEARGTSGDAPAADADDADADDDTEEK